MPIAASIVWRMTAMLLVVSALALPAVARVVVTSADSLADDPAVRKLSSTYRTLSSANVLYAQCGKQLNITDAQQQYLADQFQLTSRQYMQAYVDAYTARVGGGAPPPPQMTESFTKRMTTEQQNQVNQMALLLRQRRGCAAKELKPVLSYLENGRLAQMQREAAQHTVSESEAASAAAATNAAMANTKTAPLVPPPEQDDATPPPPPSQ